MQAWFARDTHQRSGNPDHNRSARRRRCRFQRDRHRFQSPTRRANWFRSLSSFALVRKQFRGRFPGAHSIRVFLPGMEAGHNLADRQRDLCCFRSGVYRDARSLGGPILARPSRTP